MGVRLYRWVSDGCVRGVLSEEGCQEEGEEGCQTLEEGEEEGCQTLGTRNKNTDSLVPDTLHITDETCISEVSDTRNYDQKKAQFLVPDTLNDTLKPR